MAVKEKIYDLGESVKNNGDKIKKGLKYGAFFTVTTGMILGGGAVGTQEVNAVERMNKRPHQVRRYAFDHVERSNEQLFKDFHYHIKIEEDRGRPKKDPVKILDNLADEYGRNDGKTYDWERAYLSQRLDTLFPKLADLEYGDGSGEAKWTEIDKMRSDLRKNKMFDMADKYTKEYTNFYEDIKMTDRDLIKRYMSPEKQDIMYRTFRDVFDEDIRRKRKEGLPRAPEERRRYFDEKFVDEIIKEILREIIRKKF